MFIILEGTDASGKSTLANEVREVIKLRHPYTSLMEIHNGRPRELTRDSVLQDYVFEIESNPSPHYDILADRWHWGEVTYAPVKRPETNIDGYGLLGRAGWRWVELFLASRGAATFWIDQPLEVVKARMKERGDSYITENELDHIYRLYHIASSDTITLAEVLSPEADSLNDVADLAKFVVSRALFEESKTAFLRKCPEYIGPINPNVLFVVDDTSDEDTSILPLVPRVGSAGDLFFRGLDYHSWMKIGVVTLTDYMLLNMEELVSKLHYPKIVAIGTNVANALLHGFHPEKIAHMAITPEDVLSMSHGQQKKYRQELNKLITNPEYQGDEAWHL